ncbi:MAG TPA: hypothetical protein VGG28_31260 [Kofleriaceae bacterium]|jgi:hypothetical protein
MAYRDDATGALTARAAEGELRAELGPTVTVALGDRRLLVTDRFASLIERDKQLESFELATPLVVARDPVYDDLGVWTIDAQGARRVFGARPRSTLEPGGLDDLRRFEDVARQIRSGLAPHAGDVVRASEHGRVALDKVLMIERGERIELFARKLFKDRARLVVALHPDRRVVVDGIEVTLGSPYSITVRGDLLRFADETGTDRAQVALPWLAAEERQEVARRLAAAVRASVPA